jgi:uncharacterized membrane protein
VTEEAGDRHAPEPGQGKPPGRHWLARSGFIEYDRVVFFSDAIFAIAITLLAVNLRVPEGGGFGSAHELSKAIPSIRGFWISFAVIALFWMGHHSVFRYIVAADRPLILLNLLFLGAIAFLPYPTDVISQASTQRAAVIFYASCGAFAGLAETALWLYAAYSSAGLTDDSIAGVRLFFLLRIVRIPAIFLISIPIALVDPVLALWAWLLIWLSGVVLNTFGPKLSSREQLD